MNWEQACLESSLEGLPYKIELNGWGQIVMSPVSIRHIIFQDHISTLIKKLLKHGKTLQEFPIETSENIKVTDVAWLSDDLLRQVADKFASPAAPEICIEVMSPGNSRGQILHKGKLYFEKGAKEFWICDLNGKMEFYNASGRIKKSEMIAKFPKIIEI